MAANRFKLEEGVEAIGNSVMQGNLTITDTMYIGNNNFEFNTNAIAVPTSANVTIDQYPSASYKFAKYFVTIRNDANTLYHAQELVVVNHGSNVFMTTYGEVWNNYPLGDIEAVVVSGNVNIFVVPTANATPLTVSTYRTIQA